MLSDPPQARLTNLALPLGFTGAAGGWVAGRLLTERINVTRLGLAPKAAAVGALVGVIAGLVLTSRLRRPEPPRGGWMGSLMLLLVAAGIAAGAVLQELVDGDGLFASILWGVTSALALAPLAFHLVATSLRARRGRLGSVVAAADRRAGLGALALVAAVTGLVLATDWELCDSCFLPTALEAWVSAHLGVLAAGLALVVSTAMLLLDQRALRRLRAVVEATVERGGDAAGLVEDDPRRLDLGLGDDVAAAYREGATAYRHGRELEALVIGEPARAVEALRHLRRRGQLGVAASLLAVAAHVVAAPDPTSPQQCGLVAGLGDLDGYQAARHQSPAFFRPRPWQKGRR
ncbi:MAG: hypothetical protein KC731_34630 [Myxococcales bacterium]|nr:hypothetical protein [Myxococcales bacterium]